MPAFRLVLFRWCIFSDADRWGLGQLATFCDWIWFQTTNYHDWKNKDKVKIPTSRDFGIEKLNYWMLLGLSCQNFSRKLAIWTNNSWSRVQVGLYNISIHISSKSMVEILHFWGQDKRGETTNKQQLTWFSILKSLPELSKNTSCRSWMEVGASMRCPDLGNLGKFCGANWSDGVILKEGNRNQGHGILEYQSWCAGLKWNGTSFTVVVNF